MSDEKKTYTLADMRIAFTEGAFFKYNRPHLNGFDAVMEAVGAAWEERHPTPKKLREVKDGGRRFRSDGNGGLEMETHGEWLNLNTERCFVNSSRIKLWADLLAHPYEDSES